MSLLAVVETLLATALTIAIYLYWDTLVHIIISAALAPFLLMRTPYSIDRAITFSFVADRKLADLIRPLFLLDWFPKTRLGEVVYITVTLLVFVFLNLLCHLGFLVSRSFAFILGVVLHPVSSFSAVPNNWRQLVLYTDSVTLPEVVQGIHDLPANDPRYDIRKYTIERLRELFHSHRNPYVRIMLLSAVAFSVIAGVAYRWSLKSTALIWSPLVWIFRPTDPEKNLQIFARGIITLSIYKFVRLYSLFVLVLFVLKAATLIWWLYLAQSFEKLSGWPVLREYIAPQTLPLWHITAAANALLTWIIFFAAEYVVHLSSSGVKVDNRGYEKAFRFAFVSRNLLAIYTALCTFYITARFANQFDFRVLNVIVFPW